MNFFLNVMNVDLHYVSPVCLYIIGYFQINELTSYIE